VSRLARLSLLPRRARGRIHGPRYTMAGHRGEHIVPPRASVRLRRRRNGSDMVIWWQFRPPAGSPGDHQPGHRAVKRAEPLAKHRSARPVTGRTSCAVEVAPVMDRTRLLGLLALTPEHVHPALPSNAIQARADRPGVGSRNRARWLPADRAARQRALWLAPPA